MGQGREDGLSRVIVGAAIEVHRHLGPGLLESAYEACLAHELQGRGVAIERQNRLEWHTRAFNLTPDFGLICLSINVLLSS